MVGVTFGPGYIRTSQGILKICEFVVCFIGLILVAIDGWTVHLINAYIVGSAAGLIVSLLLFILYITKLGKPMQGVLAFQLYLHLIFFIYMLIVSAVLLSKKYPDRYMAGGGFGIIAAILFLVDTIDCYRCDSSPLMCLS